MCIHTYIKTHNSELRGQEETEIYTKQKYTTTE